MLPIPRADKNDEDAILGPDRKVRGLDCLDGAPLIDLKSERIAAND